MMKAVKVKKFNKVNFVHYTPKCDIFWPFQKSIFEWMGSAIEKVKREWWQTFLRFGDLF